MLLVVGALVVDGTVLALGGLVVGVLATAKFVATWLSVTGFGVVPPVTTAVLVVAMFVGIMLAVIPCQHCPLRCPRAVRIEGVHKEDGGQGMWP